MTAKRAPIFTLLLAPALAIAAAAPVQGQSEDLTRLLPVPDDYSPAMTPWGEPDFRGGWPIDHLNGTPFERPVDQGERVFLTEEEYAAKTERLAGLRARYEAEDQADTMGMGHWAEMGDSNRRTSFLVLPANGRLPAKTEEGQRNADLMRSSWRNGQSFRSWTDFDSWDRCITRGLPTSMFPGMYNNGIRIFQSPGLVAMQLEMIHEVRLIPTDGRPAIPAQIGNWMGESRGHWEDENTLVIETTNFRPGRSAGPAPNSDQMKITERLTMMNPDQVHYEAWIEDPLVMEGTYKVDFPWERDSDYEIFEYACHEGNVQIRGYITATSPRFAEERAATWRARGEEPESGVPVR